MHGLKRKNKQAIAFLGIFVGILLFFIAAADYIHKPRRLNVSGNWDKEVLELDGKTYCLRDLAWYIAQEESRVEEQARIYNPADTNVYWNMHTNGEFVKIAARDAAMDMAIHDLIFYSLSLENGLSLNETEVKQLEMKQYDFWSDLSAYQVKVLEPLKEQILYSMELKALAQKQQEYLAEINGVTYNDYSQEGEAYQRMLQEHSYKINKDVWECLEFGNLTISHAEE